MEDDRETRDGEPMIQETERPKRSDDRERSTSRERRRDDDRHRHRHHSRSRSRSPRRHRHRSYSHSRSRSRSRDRRDRDRDRGHRSSRRISPPALHGRGPRLNGPRGDFEKSVGGPMNAPTEEAAAHAKVSKRENRLYIGNLAYHCNYKDLEKFMRGSGGDVIFTEIFITPAGQSKGCGIVEFSNPEDTKKAKEELSEKPLFGRNVHIREDREENARFGMAPIPGKVGVATGESRNFLGAHGPRFNPANRNIFVGNLPLQASWQDLKDLMRQAGEVIRADIGVHPDGNPKGNGTVVYLTPEAARAAIRK
ncbi:RNP domain-containing protein [Tremella mesenterica]|uniref:RNP domain-containing protein n=1 Tax=Tremella mesenterica TaxID=5217 RepID=A0A4V1M3T6_TREME|nr:RNP domain-containing protein [Tremella mesenterica]